MPSALPSVMPSIVAEDAVPPVTAHDPVLAAEVVRLLDPRPGETAVDCTFGAGGHAALLAPGLGPDGTYVAIDRDPEARRWFDAFAERAEPSTRLVRGNYAEVLPELAEEGLRADIVLMDLGVSSMQVDRPERGFSYSRQAPLDMRMDPDGPRTAADLLAEADEAELAGWFRAYGEERHARAIARAIVRRRGRAPILTTADLVEIIRGAVPAPALFAGGHPAKRVFQALRIAVNDELSSLEAGLGAAFALLPARRAPGRHLVPLARGPDREALHGRPGARVHLPARSARLRVRAHGGGRPAGQGAGAPRRGGRPQPPLPLGPPARTGAPGGRMTARAGARVAPSPRPRPRTRPEAPLRVAPSRPRTRPSARRARRRLPRSRIVIPVIALLLGGIVWVKVSQLTLVTRTSQAIERYQAVKSETLRLNTELARRDGDVIRLARTRLGMVPSPPNGVTYLKLPRTPASP